MKYFIRNTNNYWRTLRKKVSKPYNREIMWWIIKLALLVIRLVCKFIDSFDGKDV